MLFYNLINEIDIDLVIAPVNILLILLIIVSLRVGLRVTWKYFDKISDLSSKIRLGRRKDTLYRLTRQFSYALGLVLVVQSISITNDHIDFQTFLDFPLLKMGQFELRIYTLILAIFLFFLARVVLNLFKLYLHRNLASKDWVDEGKEYTIYQLVRYCVYTAVLLTLLRSTGLSMSLLLNAAAAFAVAVGLGLQKTFADYISGFVLLFDGSIKVGDIIEWEGEPSKVTQINIRTSKVETLGKSVIVIPNSDLAGIPIETRNNVNKLTRYKVSVGVAYGTDLELAKKLLLEAAEHPKVSQLKKSEVWLTDFGSDGLMLDLFFWTVEPFSLRRTQSDIRFKINELFEQNNITIPFPQRTIHIRDQKL